MRQRLNVAVTALAVAFAALAANADTLQRGDVILDVGYNVVMCPTPAGELVFSPDLIVNKSYIYDSGKVAIDASGNIYVLADWDQSLTVRDVQFQRIRTIELLEPSSSFTVDDTGRAYVVGESGLVRVYSPESDLVLTFTLPNVDTPVKNLSMDMAPDRCTLVYASSGGAAQRYDICSATSSPAVGANFDAVRAMRGGGFVGATGGFIDFFDANGRLVAYRQSPSASRVAALAFSADGDTLFVASGSQLYAMPLTAHAVRRQTTNDRYFTAHALAVFGEERPSSTSFATKRRVARH